MNIFSISNLVSIKIQNYSGAALSIDNKLVASPSEVDIKYLGFTPKSFYNFITKDKPGLFAILSNPRNKIKLIPVTSGQEVNPPIVEEQPADEMPKEEEIQTSFIDESITEVIEEEKPAGEVDDLFSDVEDPMDEEVVISEGTADEEYNPMASISLNEKEAPVKTEPKKKRR